MRRRRHSLQRTKEANTRRSNLRSFSDLVRSCWHSSRVRLPHRVRTRWTLQKRLGEIENAGGTLFGISADSAFSQEAFADAHHLDFELVSDMAGRAINAYDLSIDIPELGLHEIANRAVYVIDEDGAVTYRWTTDDPTSEPDYDALIEAVESA